jgi:hypothetical protein
MNKAASAAFLFEAEGGGGEVLLGNLKNSVFP